MKKYEMEFNVPDYSYSTDGEVVSCGKVPMHSTYYLGECNEIKSLYRSMLKANRKGNYEPYPGNYTDLRFMDEHRLYALEIQWEREAPYYQGVVFDPRFDIVTSEIFSGAMLYCDKMEICGR